jgi:hypothetical protein
MDPTDPTCAYRVEASLIEALDTHLGPPLDAYLMGWQVWLEEHGPGGATMEWRLHPPARFRMPRGIDHNDLFDVVLQGMADVEDPMVQPFAVGREQRTLPQVWEVLEVFSAFDDAVTTEQLVATAAAALGGRPPDTAGLVDHDRMGGQWKAARGDFSVASVLLELPHVGA